MENLNFSEWLNLSDSERQQVQENWNVYEKEGYDIAKNVVEKFKCEYGKLPNLTINDNPGIYHGGKWVISIHHPFIFDRRDLPDKYLGIEIRGGVNTSDLPKEFHMKDRMKDIKND